MNILFISGNLCDGGAQRVIALISSQMAREGHNVSLLLFSRNSKEYSVDEKVNILSLGNNFQEYSNISKWKRMMMIRKIIKKNHTEVAIGFLEGGYALFLSSFGMNIKKIASSRIDPKIILTEKGMRAKLDRIWFKNADAVVVQTRSQVKHAKNAGWAKMTVIANPISDSALCGNGHIYREECKKIIMVGRLATQKNYFMALDAMMIVCNKHPEIILNIFGKGNKEEEILKKIEEKKLCKNVFLNDWTQTVQKEYEQHDIFLLTSDFEGMPNALMEAMAAGLPCISTNCDTGPSDLIDDGENGIIVPVGDVETLANRIMYVAENTAIERARMGQKAYQKMKNSFNIRTITREWVDLFSELEAN